MLSSATAVCYTREVNKPCWGQFRIRGRDHFPDLARDFFSGGEEIAPHEKLPEEVGYKKFKNCLVRQESDSTYPEGYCLHLFHFMTFSPDIR